MNWTSPGRAHLIITWRLTYATVWFRGRRRHWCVGSNI
jgi:hypothetical protein